MDYLEKYNVAWSSDTCNEKSDIINSWEIFKCHTCYGFNREGKLSIICNYPNTKYLILEFEDCFNEIDCSKTENFLSELKRLHNSNKFSCENCCIPVNCKKYCLHYIMNNIEDSIDRVQKWSNEHPRKTYIKDFYERFPNYKNNEHEVYNKFCRKLLYERVYVSSCDISCEKCWNEHIEGELK